MRPGAASIPELARELAAGTLTARDLVADCLEAVSERNGALNAVLHVDATGALAAAAASDERHRRGSARGPLDGIPVLVKDNLAVRGQPLTCGSRILAGYVPPRDATAVDRLRSAGAVILGKTNLDEFGMGSSNEHSAFGPVRNPHAADRVAGGSSGGSAAAVAAGFAPLALGSDTGGSVRLPAAWCGVVGVKPGYGRVSRSGLVAFGSSLDQVGPITRDVRGAALALAVLAGPDVADATTLSTPWMAPDLSAPLPDGLRVGVLGQLLEAPTDPALASRVREVVAVLRGVGAEAVPVELPHLPRAVAAYYVLASAEASSNLARFDGIRYGHRDPDASTLDEVYVRTRSSGFGAEVQRRILLGTYALSAGYADRYYHRATRVRELLRRDLDAAFARADVLVAPVAPEVAFRLGERVDDPVRMYATDVMTVPASLAGIPALSVPAGPVAGLPAAVQLLAPAGEEARLLRVAAAVESEGGA